MTIWQNISSGLPQGLEPPQPWVLGQVYRNRHEFPSVEHVSSSIKKLLVVSTKVMLLMYQRAHIVWEVTCNLQDSELPKTIDPYYLLAA